MGTYIRETTAGVFSPGTQVWYNDRQYVVSWVSEYDPARRWIKDVRDGYLKVVHINDLSMTPRPGRTQVWTV